MEYTPGAGVSTHLVTDTAADFGQSVTEISGAAPPGLTLVGEAICAPSNLCTYYNGTVAPGTTGTFTTQVQAIYDLDSAVLTITWEPAFKAPGSLTASAVVGLAYSSTLTPSGGVAPITWSLFSGALPPGLSLNAGTGEVGGTPSTAGNYNFVLRATDADLTPADSASQSITVYDALAVTTLTLPATTVGASYAQTLTSTGGTAPKTWSITAGLLPPCLELTAGTGQIGSFASMAGTEVFTVQVACCSGATAQKVLSITVNPAPQVTTSSLPDGSVSVPYSRLLAATGGTAPFTWSIHAGSLPAGLTLTPATGAITGTPSAIETANFTVQVSDSVSVIAQQALSIEVLNEPVITTLSLAPVTVGSSVAATLAALSGTLPYTWSVLSGSLPAGITLNPSSGALTGTPTTAGIAAFTIQLADAGKHATTQAFVWTVEVDPNVLITTSSLPVLTATQDVSIPLAASGGTPPYTWSLSEGGLPHGLELIAATGMLSGRVIGSGTFPLSVRAADTKAAANTRALELTVNPLARVTSSRLRAATAGGRYSARLDAEGGTLPLDWSGVDLPDGLTLDNAGRLQGTFSTAGQRKLRVSVSDANHLTTGASLEVEVHDAPEITTSSIPVFRMGQPVVFALRATGGIAPLSWYVTPSLPPGLTMARDGVIRGRPGAAGDFSQTFRVLDSSRVSAERDLPLEVTQRPRFEVSPLSLRFEAPAGDPATAGQQVVMVSEPPHADLDIAGDADWLALSLDAAQTPAVLSVAALPAGLDPGEYEATVEINGPETRAVAVRFVVSERPEPSVAVDPGEVTLSILRGGAGARQLLLVKSVGEDGDVSAAADPDWISVSVNAAPAGSQYAATLLLAIDAEGLEAGRHQGELRVSRGSSEATVPVSVEVTAADFELSHSGLTFNVAPGVPDRPSQTLRVLNHDAEPLDWLAATRASWLLLDPPAGTAEPESPLRIVVDASGFEPGVYSSAVTVAAGQQEREAQVRLHVSEEVLRPRVSPYGLLFEASPEGRADSQIVALNNPNGAALDFTAAVAPLSAASWLTVTPLSGSIPAGESVTLTAKVRTAGLPAGIHRAGFNIGFAGQLVQVVDAALVISEQACEARQLVAVFTHPGEQFRVRLGSPLAMELRVTDNCGRPVSEGVGMVFFSTPAERALELRPGASGLWTATWTPAQAHESITATGMVNSVDATRSGSDSSTGAVVVDTADAWQDPKR